MLGVRATNAEPLLGSAKVNPDHVKKIAGLFAVLVTVGVVVTLVLHSPASSQETTATDLANKRAEPRNVILLIPDGTGPASWTLTRESTPSRKLNIDKMARGTIRTYSHDSLVTDSASAATSYASAIKTYNAAIGVDYKGLPVGTLMESAKTRGLRTGFVVTSRVTHATPAAFSSHVIERNMEEDIAAQQVTKNLDFALGGGRRFFNASLRADRRDLLREIEQRGNTLLTTDAAFRQFESNPQRSFPFWYLGAEDHMDYEIDRAASQQPSLREMTQLVLRMLDQAQSADGRSFFLMIEGSRPDHAAHANDIAAHVRELQHYDSVIGLVQEYAAQHPRTLVISVADHETGGITLGRDGVYEWLPSVLLRVNRSAEFLASSWTRDRGIDMWSAFAAHVGIPLTDAQFATLEAARGNANSLREAIVRIVNPAARIGVTTGGHTGTDVVLHASGPADLVAELLTGVRENTHIADVIESYLGLSIAEETQRLRNSAAPTPAPL